MNRWTRMARCAAAVGLAAVGIVAAAGPAHAAPANDDRATATPLMPGATINGDNTGATMETGEAGNSCSTSYQGGTGGATVWYSIGIAAGQTLNATMTPLTGADQALSVYGPDGTTELTCSDTGVGGQAESVSYAAPSATTLLISVAGFTDADQGPFSLFASTDGTPPPPPPPPSGGHGPITATPTLDFGQVPVGTTSPQQEIVLTNADSVPTDVSVGTATESPQNEEGPVQPAPDECASPSGGVFTVPANGSCSVSVSFAPVVVGPWQLDVDWLWNNGEGTSSVHTTVTGEGVDGTTPPPDIPEAPMALLLPGSTILLGAGVFLVRRRTARSNQA